MRKPTTEDVHASQRLVACPQCGVSPGILCVNISVPRHNVHMTRAYAYLAMVAPEICKCPVRVAGDAALLAALGLSTPANPECPAHALLAKIGWYLQEDIAIKRTGATLAPTCHVYITGKVQSERLHVSIVESAVNAGWLRMGTGGRHTFIATPRGLAARLSHGGEWQRLPAAPKPRKLSAALRTQARAAVYGVGGFSDDDI